MPITVSDGDQFEIEIQTPTDIAKLVFQKPNKYYGMEIFLHTMK